MLFDGVTLILPDALQADSRLRVENGAIAEISAPGRQLIARSGEHVINGAGAYLAPGFIDAHVHGALGRDTMEASAEAFAAILGFHARGGTTAMALTSVAAPHADLLRLLGAARAWKRSEPPAGAHLLGIHLEGPYFSPVKPGAHRLEFIREPVDSEVRELLEFPDVITQITLAPELPGARGLIEAALAAGILPSAGHSDAWEEDAQAAFERGLRHVTHAFNAMSSARRRGPFRAAGLLEFALSEPSVRCEVIADGRHVCPTLLRMLYQAKGADGICLVTDASPGAGLPEGARYRLGDLECIVRDGAGMTLDGSALAGSTATMIACVKHIVEAGGVPLVEAIRMAALNPARALCLEKQRGQLLPGLAADLVLLSASLDVEATYVGGERVFQSAERHGH